MHTKIIINSDMADRTFFF